MKWLLGPGAHALLAPLHDHDLLAAQITQPEQAWAYQQELPNGERLWLIADQHFLEAFCHPPWQGLYHLVALVSEPPSRALAQQAQACVGSAIRPARLAEFCHALQWPSAEQLGETQRSSVRGTCQWLGSGSIPSALKPIQGTCQVPVSKQPGQRWPAAQFWQAGDTLGEHPLLLADQWMANRSVLDALANLREHRAQTL